MDWVMVVLILTEAPNFTQSHSHAWVNFTSEKLCTDAKATLISDMEKPTQGNTKVIVRASCLQRK
jgi:hypothetical protein